MKKYRVAIGGIATENSTFSIWTTQLENFAIVRGTELAERYPFLESYPHIEFVPLLRARALPGGPVAYNVYQQIRDELLSALRDGTPWDGIYLDMHGAMYVRDLPDSEGDWMSAIRNTAGTRCVIAASYDLHGNVSQRVFDNVDILTAYRTAPHVDTEATRERAIRLLTEILEVGQRPKSRLYQIPVALPGEKTSTEWEPGQSLYAEIDNTIKRGGILDASILVGYAWADEPRTGATVIVYGQEQVPVDDEARRLAQAYWNRRKDFRFGVPAGTSDECISMALAAEESCMFISDSGDNPTAGGVGDVTYTLERMIARDVPTAIYASIPDAVAVAQCHDMGVGSQISLEIGGKLDTVYGKPLPITGTVINLAAFPRHEYGRSFKNQINRQAVIRVGNINIILTEYRTPFHYISQFEQLALDPLKHKLVVIKIGYLEPDLKRVAPKALLALSPGAVNQALEQLPYRHIRRPMFPFDQEMEWEL
jgi:microcystin degradation protein MlrC